MNERNKWVKCPECDEYKLTGVGHTCRTQESEEVGCSDVVSSGKFRAKAIKEATRSGDLLSENRRLKKAMSESWQIINVLNMSEMDNGEAYPKALEWMDKWEHLKPSNLS